MPLELVPAEHPNGGSRSDDIAPRLEQQLSPSSSSSPLEQPLQPLTTLEQQLARIDAETDPQRRGQRLRELASALEHQHDDPARALTALLTAYRELPTRAAWSHLERLATITNNWSELATELAAAMDDLDAADRADAWLHLGHIYARQLDHADHALACYEQALTLDPDFTAARTAIEATLRARGDHAALLPRLEERLVRATELERRALRLELAGLYAQLGERGEATGRYEELRRELPSDLTILRALEKLYDDARRVNDLVDVLETQAGLVDGARDRATLYRRLAIEWEEQLGRADRAAECWQWLLSFDAASDEAYRALERLYSAEGNWRAAVDIYCRHAATIVDAGERARLHTEVARICERQLEDAAGAIEFYRKVEADRPGTVDAMSAPIRLYERTEDYAEVVALLEKRAERAQGSARAELYHRAAELTRVQLANGERAVALLDSALAADAAHVPSLVTLAEIYRERGKLSTADRLLERAVAATAHPLQRTRLYVRRAELRQALDDGEGAIALYGAALELDPDDHDAATAAIALLEKAGRTTELRPLVERLAATEGDVERRVDRWLQLAQLDEELGAPEQALKAIDRALMLAPGRLSTVHQRGALLFRLGRFADAHIALGSLVDDLGALGVDEVELRWQLGRCALALGCKRDAHLHFSCALALDPQHKPSRAAQIELDREHPSALIDHQRALLAAAAPGERPALLAAIGDLYASLADPDQALDAYRQALALAPDDARLLHKCLDTLVAQKEWPATLPLLDRLVALAPPGARRGRYLEAAGLITYDELDRPDAAVPLLSRALEDDATLDRAADALEELWTQRHDWTALANLHGLRLQRLGPACHDGEQAVRGRLWSKLGDLCLNRLGDRDSALAALEAAARFDPYDLARHRLLAALYAQTPGKQAAAIAEHLLVVANSGGELESYAALEQLYRRSGQPLRSAACGTSLNFLEQRRDAAHADDVTDLATLDDASAADEQPLPRAAAALTPQLWARLAHRDEDRHLSALFALLTPFLMTDQAQAHRQLGLDKKDQVAGNDPRTFARVMQYVARTLGVPAPDAFVRYDQPTAAQFVSCLHQQRLQATLIIGKPLLGTRRSERELAFYLAQQLSYLRPGRIVRWLAPDPLRLLRLVEVALALAANEPLDGERAATALQVKASLTPLGFDQLLTLAAPVRAYGSELELRIRCWMRATDLTAMRAALLLVGDLELCARLGELETSLADRRVLHLAAAHVSDAMFAAREHLKLLAAPAQPRRLRSRRPLLAKVKFL